MTNIVSTYRSGFTYPVSLVSVYESNEDTTFYWDRIVMPCCMPARPLVGVQILEIESPELD
jgi:hypothetical protein